MAMKVTKGKGWVMVECGTQVLVVGGHVLAGPYDSGDPTAPGPGVRPELPPTSSSGGVSVSAATIKILGDDWLHEIEPGLESLFAVKEFKGIASLIREPLVITIDPSGLRTSREKLSELADISGVTIPVSHKLFSSE